MHRSGTSLLSGMMHDFGFDHGVALAGSDESNQKGYFENRHIVNFNEQLLRRLGITWFDPFTGLATDARQRALFGELKDELGQLLHDEFASAGPIVLKDPRICLLLPFWKEAFREFHLVPVYLHIFRHPREVASSLLIRDNINPGITERLWLHYNLLAEKNTRGEQRLLVSYGEMMKDIVRTEKRIQAFLSRQLGMDFSGINSDIIDPSLHHHEHTDSTPLRYALAGELNNLLINIANDSREEKFTENIDSIGSRMAKETGLEDELGTALQARITVIYTDGSKQTGIFGINENLRQFFLGLDQEKVLSAVHFTPSATACIIHVIEFFAEGKNSASQELTLYSSNTEWTEDKVYHFCNSLPHMHFKPVTQARMQGIKVKVEYLAIGKNALRLSSRIAFRQMKSLNESLRRQKSYTSDILQSWSRKTGRAVTFPFRIIMIGYVKIFRGSRMSLRK
jgi:hypothetical protein